MKHIFIIIFALLCSGVLVADAGIADTAKIYVGREVIVTATRTPIQIQDSPSPISVITMNELEQVNGHSIADLLRTTEGIFLKDQGAMGAMKTISLRGVSSENVAILLNGNPINDPQNGQLDLSLIALDNIERVEMLRGGGSALYGADALGGVVNIITRKAPDNFRLRLGSGFGSFGASQLSAEAAGRVSGIGIVVGGVTETGKDDYPFILHRQPASDTALNRSDADYKKKQFYVNADYPVTETGELNCSAQFVRFERGTPGPLSSFGFQCTARQNDDVGRLSVSFQEEIFSSLRIAMNMSYNNSNEKYLDPENLFPSDLVYKSEYYLINAHAEWFAAPWDRLTAGYEFADATLHSDGNSFGLPFQMDAKRTQQSAYLSNEILLQNQSEWFDRYSFYQTLRYDNFSTVESALSPKLGVNMRIMKAWDVRVRGSWGMNFRVPTFNDMYYPGFSNPHLKPEHSISTDIGILSNLEPSGRQTVQMTYFVINTKDKIVVDPMTYIPLNIGKSENDGLEFRYDYHSSDEMFNAYVGFTFVDALKKDKATNSDATYNKQLTYIPKSYGTLGLTMNSEVVQLNLVQSITGIRYTNNENTRSLPSYSLTDVHVSKSFVFEPLRLKMQLGIHNLFNADYQIFDGYPMPGRSYNFSLSFEY